MTTGLSQICEDYTTVVTGHFGAVIFLCDSTLYCTCNSEDGSPAVQPEPLKGQFHEIVGELSEDGLICLSQERNR